MNTASEKYRLGILEGLLSIIGNISLFGLKIWAGLVSGSVALMADAWHSLSDTISSVLLILGLKYALKPADKEHPFGYGRAETIVSLVIGILLILIAFHFLVESIDKLKNTESADFGLVAIIVTISSILVKEIFARYAFYVARKTGSESVRADGWHHRSDALSSVVILAGIFFKNRAWWIDGLMGVIIAIIIFYSAIIILKNTINNLLGRKPDDEIISEIKKIAGNIYKGNLRLHHFHIHNYGFHSEMTFHIVLPGNIKLSEATYITEELFKEIKIKLDILATIHIDTKSKY